MTADLVQFLRDRLAEDEELRHGARTWTDRDWQAITSPHDDRVTVMDESNVVAWIESDGEPGLRIGAHVARYDPARTRIDIEAKRELLDTYAHAARLAPEMPGATAVEYALRPILRKLADGYRDHPEYRAEWAPEG